MKMDFERTFDHAAQTYDRSRPEYPAALYRDLFSYQPLDAQSHVLEIGLGTGKATQPVLETDCHVTGIEPGSSMAALANERLKAYPHFSLHIQTLQEYEGQKERFDLVYAATAFHWIEEAYGYARVFELLKSGGAFARFAYHAGPDEGRPQLTQEIQALYGRYMPSSGKTGAFGEAQARKIAQLALGYGFTDVHHALYRQTRDFTADEYMGLLATYPNHMALEEEQRKSLFEGIHAAILRHGGVMTVYYTFDLELARKP